MSNLSTILGGGSSAGTGWEGTKSPDRFKEPCFATVGHESGSAWGGTVVYDHNLNLVGQYTRTNSGYSSSSQITDWGGTELGNDHSEGLYTQSQVDSQSTSRGALTCGSGLTGHMCAQVTKTGEYSYQYANQGGQVMKMVGTWLHNSTPDLSIFMGDSQNWIATRSNTNSGESKAGFFGEVDTSLWGTRSVGSNSRYGTISYNEKTKQFALMESNGSYDNKIHVWSNVESPARFTHSKDFFGPDNLQAQYHVESGWGSNSRPSANGSEDNYRGCVVMCDNGDVTVFKMVPHYGAYAFKFVWDGSSYSTGQNQWNASYSTSYGIDQGDRYGMRHNVSMDGKYVWAYCPRYYYGSGYMISMTRVSDGKMLHEHWGSNSSGAQFIPFRDSGMIHARSDNADSGRGMQCWKVDLKDLFMRYANNSTVNLNLSYNRNYDTVDTQGYSTNYPFIVQIMSQDMYKFIGKDEAPHVERAETLSSVSIP
jgi:hypothetical protein